MITGVEFPVADATVADVSITLALHRFMPNVLLEWQNDIYIHRDVTAPCHVCTARSIKHITPSRGVISYFLYFKL